MFLIGGGAFQWPIGRLSDRYDRRKVLATVTFSAALIAVLANMIDTSPYQPDGSGFSLRRHDVSHVLPGAGLRQ